MARIVSPLFSQALQAAHEAHPSTPGREILLSKKLSTISSEVLPPDARSINEAKLSELTTKLAEKFSVLEGADEYVHIKNAAHRFLSVVAEVECETEAAYHVPGAPTTLSGRVEAYPTEVVGPGEIGPYTAITHCVTPLETLLEMHRVSHIPIRDLIALTPERKVRHEIAIRFMLEYSLKEGESLDSALMGCIPQMQQHFLEEHGYDLARIEAQRGPNSEFFLSALKTSAPLLEGMQAYLDLATQELQRHNPAANIESDEVQEYLAMRAADLLYHQQIHNFVGRADLVSFPGMEGRTLRPHQTHATRHMYMMNGGISSGKGTAGAQVQAGALRQGVPWKDVLTINADEYKGLCMPPGELGEGYDPRYYTGLTYDEACMIRTEVLTGYQRMLDANTAPHIYVDRTVPTDGNFTLGERNENTTELYFTSLPVEKSVVLALKRGEKTGRYEPTPNILNTHVNSVKTLHKQLLAHAGKPLEVHIVANTSPTTVSPVASFHCSTKTMHVYNQDELVDLFKKLSINPGAASPEDLYLDEDTITAKTKEAIGALSAVYVAT